MASENIMHLIGYSNPTKLIFGIACNIIVGKISAENIGDMLRGGITLALIKVLVVRLFEVLRCNPGCLIYRDITTEEQSITTHALTNAMHKHMMAWHF